MTTIILSKTTSTALASLQARIVANAKQGKELENQVQLAYGKCEPLVASYIWMLAQPFIKAVDAAKTPEALRDALGQWYETFNARLKALGEVYCEARQCKDNAWRTLLSRAKASLKEDGKKIPTLQSQSDNAIQKRATKQPKTPQEPQKNSGKASSNTPYDKKLSIADIKKEVGDSMANLFDTIQGHIPEGKRKEYLSLQTAFIANVHKLLGTK